MSDLNSKTYLIVFGRLHASDTVVEAVPSNSPSEKSKSNVTQIIVRSIVGLRISEHIANEILPLEKSWTGPE